MGNVSWMVLVLDVGLYEYYTDLAICLKVFLIPSFGLCFNICFNITFSLVLGECDQPTSACAMSYSVQQIFHFVFLLHSLCRLSSKPTSYKHFYIPLQCLLFLELCSDCVQCAPYLLGLSASWGPEWEDDVQIWTTADNDASDKQLRKTDKRWLCSLVSGRRLGTLNAKQLWNGTQDADFGMILCNHWWNHLNDMRRWYDIIKMGHNKWALYSVERIHFSQEREQWQACVNTVINIRAS